MGKSCLPFLADTSPIDPILCLSLSSHFVLKLSHENVKKVKTQALTSSPTEADKKVNVQPKPAKVQTQGKNAFREVLVGSIRPPGR
jgi:hypothetical protein